MKANIVFGANEEPRKSSGKTLISNDDGWIKSGRERERERKRKRGDRLIAEQTLLFLCS
jgi:hypothetical protein